MGVPGGHSPLQTDERVPPKELLSWHEKGQPTSPTCFGVLQEPNKSLQDDWITTLGHKPQRFLRARLLAECPGTKTNPPLTRCLLFLLCSTIITVLTTSASFPFPRRGTGAGLCFLTIYGADGFFIYCCLWNKPTDNPQIPQRYLYLMLNHTVCCRRTQATSDPS